MAVNALDLLTTALTQTGLPADTPTATGTPTPTDDFAALFQTVLANALNQATVQATATVATEVPVTDAATLQENPSDLLNSLLGLLDQDTDDTDPTADPTAVNADALSQLLANLGVNVQQFTPPPQAPPPSTPADSTPTTPLGSPVFRALENANPLAAPANQSLTPVVASNNTPPAGTVTPTTVPLPSEQLAASPALSSPAESVAGANRVAGRNPSIVAQVPIVTDLNQGLPKAVDPSGRAVAPPVNEPTPVQGVPPVNPGVNPTVVQDARPATDLSSGATPVAEPTQAVIVRSPVTTSVPVSTPTPANQPFTVEPARAEVPPAVVPPAPNTATAPTPAPTRPAIASPDQPTAPTVTDTAVPAVPQTTPTAAPVVTTPTRPANPDIAVTVSQPIAVPVGQLEVVKFGGVSVAGAIPIPPDQPTRSEAGTPLPFAAVPFGGNATVTTPTGETPSAVAPSPVAEQLAGPITAQVRDRPTTGETEIQIRLDPPELGAVKLKIVSTGGEVRAELHVSSEAVRQVVQSQLPDLQQRLDDAGVRVQRFDVMADPQGGTARDGRGEQWRGPPPVELPPPPVRPRLAAVTAPATGRLDVNA